MNEQIKLFLKENVLLLDTDIQQFLLETTSYEFNNSEVADLFEILETAGVYISRDEIETFLINILNEYLKQFFDNTSRDEWERYFYDEYPIEETEDFNRRIFHIYPLFQGFRCHMFNLTNKEIQTIIDKNREKINLDVDKWEILL